MLKAWSPANPAGLVILHVRPPVPWATFFIAVSAAASTALERVVLVTYARPRSIPRPTNPISTGMAARINQKICPLWRFLCNKLHLILCFFKQETAYEIDGIPTAFPVIA